MFNTALPVQIQAGIRRNFQVMTRAEWVFRQSLVLSCSQSMGHFQFIYQLCVVPEVNEGWVYY